MATRRPKCGGGEWQVVDMVSVQSDSPDNNSQTPVSCVKRRCQTRISAATTMPPKNETKSTKKNDGSVSAALRFLHSRRHGVSNLNRYQEVRSANGAYPMPRLHAKHSPHAPRSLTHHPNAMLLNFVPSFDHSSYLPLPLSLPNLVLVLKV